MDQIPKQLEELLDEKGYLSEAFQTGTSVGSWLLRLIRLYEANRDNAHQDQEPRSFSVQTSGEFDNQLDKLYITFHFRYNPGRETLSLITLEARLRDTKKTNFYNNLSELPHANDLYEALCQQTLRKKKPVSKKNPADKPFDRNDPRHAVKLLQRVKRQQDRDHNPDYDPYLHMEHPQFNQVNDLHKDEEFPENPPNDLTTFFRRPPRR
jgi:hypothetical protein